MRERWKRLLDRPEYEASNMGRIRRIETGHVLKASDDGGKMVISLPRINRLPGQRKYVSVQLHKVILLAFRGPPPRGKPWGCHYNGDHSNNRLSNLRWASPDDNAADAIRHGTWAHGERIGGSRLRTKDVVAIRRRWAKGHETQKTIAADYGVVQSTISWIVTGSTWRHVRMEKTNEG